MKSSLGTKQILAIALPISFSLLIPQISFFANAAFLGRVGETEMVINGLASIFYLFLNWVGYGTASGLMAVLSRRVGEGKLEAINKTMFNGLALGAMITVLLLLSSLLFMDFFYTHTLDNKALKEPIINYLQVKIWGLPFLVFTQMFNSLFIAINRSKLLIWSALVSNMIVVVFDYGLIFGNLGMPKLGVQGAAWAALLGEIALALTTFMVYLSRGLKKLYPIFTKARLESSILKNILTVSTPLVLQYIFSIGGWQLFFVYVEHLGASEVAVSHVLRSILGIVSVGTWGLASTCNTLVSRLIGAQKSDDVYPTIGRLLLISIGYTAIISTILLFFPKEVLQIYTNDMHIVALGLSITPILAVSILVMSLSTVCFNAVVGTGNTWINFTIESGTVILYSIFVSYIVGYLMLPIHLAWTSEIFYWSILLIASGAYLISGKWKGKHI